MFILFFAFKNLFYFIFSVSIFNFKIRWLEDGKHAATNFLGFGDGPRMCLGKRLAVMLEKMLMVHLLRECSLHCCAETQVRFE